MFSRKTIKYIFGILIAAALPLSFYFITRHYSDGHIHMPAYYRADRIDSIVKDGRPKGDTTFHRVKDIQLTNQLGRQVSLNRDLQGKILVIDFIFTTCNSICPKITANMRILQQSFIKKNPDLVQFISISVDPARDSVSALRAYADRFNADHDRWWFLRGNNEEVFNYARNELGLSLQPSDGSPGMFDHSEKFILLDTSRHIRGYFDGTDMRDLKKIADDIIILSMEKVKE